MRIRQILLATSNQGKIRDFFDMWSLDLIELKTLDFIAPSFEEPNEDGKDFEANAQIKAEYYGKKTHMFCLSEDSGFILDSAPDLFGLWTRRQIAAKDDKEWLERFLDIIQGLENKQATFYSAIALYDPVKNQSHTFLAKQSGFMQETFPDKYPEGIPVAAIFVPNGHDIPVAQMPLEEKIKYSHRGAAILLVESFIQEKYKMIS